MTNKDLLNRLNMVLCRDPKAATANDLLEAFIWYCSSQFEKFGKLHGYYRSAILEIYNAIKWSSYNPRRITKEERNMFHPEDCTMLDGSKPSQNDFRIYLDFLEAAIEHHCEIRRRKMMVSSSGIMCWSGDVLQQPTEGTNYEQPRDTKSN